MTLLISPPELAVELAGGAPPAVLDVRYRVLGPPTRPDYLAGHIPGAVFVDLDDELSGSPGVRGRHPLPEPADLERAARRWGLREGAGVVVYDEGDATIAARAWWLLRWAGLTDVRVLDGGLAGWRAAGLPETTDVPSPDPGDVVVRPGAMPVLDAAGAAHTARHGVLLDARAGERYRGEVEPVDAVAGHVPGAISAPTAENVASDGRLLAPELLRARFAGLGVRAGRPVGTYCGSGVTAAHQVLALARAGIPAALYVGSWSEWIADPARPVEVGAGPPRP